MDFRILAGTCLTVASVLALGACTERLETADGPKVGMVHRDYADSNRVNWAGDGPRPLATTIWYPTTTEAEPVPVQIPNEDPIFVGGLAVRDAPLDTTSTQRPLVLLSHGTGGAGFQMMWLGTRLAKAGFIAAAIDHHGNTAAEDEYDPRGFLFFWERPVDVSSVLDAILADPQFDTAIDTNRIAAVGFSLGGYTVVAAAGGTIDLERFQRFCESPARDVTCDPQPEYPDARADYLSLVARQPQIALAYDEASASYLDSRIRSVVAIAPALGQALSSNSLEGITAPVKIVVGDEDVVAPPATNAAVIAAAIPNASISFIPGAGHYSFLNLCTSRGRRFVPICEERIEGERALSHERAARLVIDHLTQTLTLKATTPQ